MYQQFAGEAGAGAANGATKVLVVDDHPAVRWGLVQLLDDQPDLAVRGVATSAEGAVGQAEHEGIEVAVVDYQLGGRNGLWLTRKLKALEHPPRVVIFSAFANDHLAAGCVVAGADALLSKGSLGDELCNTIRSVHRGRQAAAARAALDGGPAAQAPRGRRADDVRDAARRDPRARDLQDARDRRRRSSRPAEGRCW